jgi:hypothetical protein
VPPAYNQGYPLTGFKQLRDQVLTLGHGVHGVRETFDYTYPEGHGAQLGGAVGLMRVRHRGRQPHGALRGTTQEPCAVETISRPLLG